MEQARPAHKVRFVTATTLFDGHDASINVFRRILQASGAEVIHLGHNRSGEEIVDAAVEEDAQAIAVTSYQGGHMEFFRYLRDLTVDRGAEHIRIFGGGGGTILPEEGEELADTASPGSTRPTTVAASGLQGMVDDMLARADFPLGELERSGSGRPGHLQPASGRAVGLRRRELPRQVPRGVRGDHASVPPRAVPRWSGSPGPADRASPRWWTRWCAATSPSTTTGPSPWCRSTRRAAARVVRSSATAYG